MAIIYKDYFLNDNSIEDISLEIFNTLEQYKIEQRMRLKVRLEIEEILLNIKSFYGADKAIKIGVGKRSGKIVVRMFYDGPSFNPVENSDNPISDEIMKQLGFAPSWAYRGKENTISLIVREREPIKSIYFTFIAIVLGFVFGFLGRLLSETTRANISEYVLTPIANLFLGLLTTFAGIMILITIINSIQGMGNARTIGKIGRSVIIRMIGACFLFSIIAIAISFTFNKYNFVEVSGNSASDMGKVAGLIFDIFPKNIVDPFRTGNALQIIVIAVFVGIVLLTLGERVSTIRPFISDLTLLLQKIVGTVCVIMPVFIFVVISKQLLIGSWTELSLLIKPFIAGFSIEVVLAFIFIIVFAIRLKCPLGLFIKKVFTPALKGFITASSLTILLPCMEACEKKCGVDKNFVSFIYPIGVVINMPVSISYFVVISLCFAEQYQIEINPLWFLVVAIVVTLTVIALPPIPGGGVLAYSIIFGALGIPLEAIAFGVIIDVVMDFVGTGLNNVVLIGEIAVEGDRLKLIDRDVLLKK